MHEAYAGLEPSELWRHFDALNKIGRPSGHESAAREYVLRVAKEAVCEAKVDAYGNCVVYVPSREPGATSAACVQAHLDMVKATAPGVEHDFEHDPIVPRREGNRIAASGTTLGADNGIGTAAALALITDTSVRTGPLELLFTVEEETGLKGAAALDGSLLSAKYLVNLDSEDPDRLTIGCAGGESVGIEAPVHFEPVPADWVTKQVRIAGLRGGHSGVEIHKNLTNAIRFLIGGFVKFSGQVRFVNIAGGSAHNAVPKESTAVFCMPPDAARAWEATFLDDAGIAEQLEAMRGHLNEPELTIDLTNAEPAKNAMTVEDSAKIIMLLHEIKSGVIKMSDVFEGKVQTSANLAVVTTRPDAVEVLVSIRSFVAGDIAAIESELRAQAKTAQATLTVSSGYPAWEPNANSKLLRMTIQAFEHIMRKPPIVEVVHAGLECGVISAKVHGMEAVSFGPTITGAHTPDEAVETTSVLSIWKLLVEVLTRLR